MPYVLLNCSANNCWTPRSYLSAGLLLAFLGALSVTIASTALYTTIMAIRLIGFQELDTLDGLVERHLKLQGRLELALKSSAKS